MAEAREDVDGIELRGEPREAMEFDVVIVGAGPSGLSAAIRLKQIDPEISVVVLEKGAEVGAHILSGAVVDPIALDRLIPDWRDDADRPFRTEVKEDQFLFLTKTGKKRLPNIGMPKLMSNHGNFIGSVANLTRYLAAKAEALEVEIYPGFAAVEVLYNEAGNVKGVATGDMGITRDDEPGPMYQRGMELHGKYTLIGEGVRGSIAKVLIDRFDLLKGKDPQKFGIGIKELWELDESQHREGLVQHSFGWPLDLATGGGSFIYHFENRQAYVGYVVHLNYRNPYLSPFDEFQRFKTHPAIAPMFEGAKRVAYGARAISEGGWQSMPRLSFPGGALMGCSAGMVNVPRIKGVHNAMLSGMQAAENIGDALEAGRANDELVAYEERWRGSEIGRDLYRVRNVKPLWSKFGTGTGVVLGGIDMWMHQLFGRGIFGTWSHGKADHEATEPAAKHAPIDYPKPDGKITFDKLSSVYLSNTNHEEDQPVHLKVQDITLQHDSELNDYAGLSTRYCPAGVYEWVDAEGNSIPAAERTSANGGSRYVINAQNCVHCKTCSIKDPNQNILWVPPQGGEGPVYPNM